MQLHLEGGGSISYHINCREVAIVDVPGAFMQAKMYETVHMGITRAMVDMLLEIDKKKYGPCVTINGKQEKAIYVRLNKAIYGTIRAACLFQEKLSSKLIKWGFQLNPYDSCVAKKMVNGKQMTVMWHLDDIKISHVEKNEVDKFIEMLSGEFGKETPLNESHGKEPVYLGMTMDYSVDREEQIDMSEYIKMILSDVPPKMIGHATTPAASHLFQVNDNPINLDNECKEKFIHYVMQFLYASQWGRPDIHTAVSFLCGWLK